MNTDKFWEKRLAEVSKALKKNNFSAYITENRTAAKELVIDRLIPELAPNSILRGDSMTCIEADIFGALTNLPQTSFIDPWEDNLDFEARNEELRKNLGVDLMITGTNALTEKGQLVNLDMVGNRIGGITFGPKNVIIVTGRNKITSDLDAAWERVRNYAAPANALRFGLNTPCVDTGRCADCGSPERICNAWSIVEKSYPKGRITVVLVNEDLGL